MKKTNKKTSIRIRILLWVLLLISFILILIIAVFNVLVAQYIKGNVNDQLYGIKDWAYQSGQLDARFVFPPNPPPPVKEPGQTDEQRKIPRGSFGRAEVLIINEDFDLIFPDNSRLFIREYNDLTEITAQLKKQPVNLNNEEIMRIRVSEREYYFISLKIAGKQNNEQTYLLYCIDMTSITNFSHRINIVLLLVLLLALVLSIGLAILLSVIITKPIKELTSFADRIGHGNFQTSEASYQDLELSTLSDSMNTAAKQLDKYDHEQKVFFQNVSHELRTPLQSIKSNAEAIEYQVMDYTKASRIIISETDRLSEMVDGLLYFSYLDSTKAQISLEAHDIREFLSNCIERQRTIADNQNIQFVCSFDKKPLMMLCDEKRLSRAFSNVLSNAIRYAKQTIHITCLYSDKTIKVTIQDDGEGITPEELPHIFDRFFKGHRGNHGIGLSIVKTVVDQHQGTIEVHSSSEGSTFTFLFTTG